MYKAAVIGLGNIGMLYDLEPQRPHPSTHVYAYEMSSEYQLICGIDGDIKKESDLHKVSPKADYYSDLGDALRDGVLDDVDVISICTPPSTHLDIILSLLNAGKGKVLFCEKPIVQNLCEAEILLKTVSDSDISIIPNISRRWNTGLRKVTDILKSQKYGRLQKVNVRYTRGIYNTGTHMFDLLKMWTGSPIKKVFTLGETHTSAIPEKSFNFYFEQNDGVTGFVESIDDDHYYLFDIDLYLEQGKIEMRNSGDDIIFYTTASHHLFQGFNELKAEHTASNLLKDACIKNAIDNINNYLSGKEKPYCSLVDAIYPLYVANALERSFKESRFEEV